MPRIPRATSGGMCHHVLNRGNGRMRVFHKDADYQAFIDLMSMACDRTPMRILGYCLMPNHFHLVLQPFKDGELSTWMQWLMTSHVRRYHAHYETSGHVWQGRFKSFPIQADEHLLAVLRYVERNALRAGLVERAEQWPFGSLAARVRRRSTSLLAPCPVVLPRRWRALVNQPQSDHELETLRLSVKRGRPHGSTRWTQRTVQRHGLISTMRARGRPQRP